ncbi:hypothetical protein M885DRAFT_511853 [Pelagophyceae sp. CCMP2097]|nr:hypothetical protein M885DRAFT_511853 [Pelagophyceae sp. CCMP2097]|mmetsp:Transcript_3156/g.11307  ORF Transcript_3156/g.11307 Transcript_3156/m.11307 type:complete len:504 (-) Transcript_3156:27-1538(-)
MAVRTDAVRRCFAESSDGLAGGECLAGDAAWRRFVGLLRMDGLLESADDVRALDHVRTSARGPITLDHVRRALAHAYADEGVAEAAAAGLAVRAAASSLQDLTWGAPAYAPRDLRELSGLCREVEGTLETYKSNVLDELASKRSQLEANRLAALVHAHLSPVPAVPAAAWQRKNVYDVEKACSRARVPSGEHVRYATADGAPPPEDAFRLARGSGVSLREARALGSDGRERDVYVVCVCAGAAAHARNAAWTTFAAHRELALAPASAPRALAWFDDHAADDARRGTVAKGLRLVYERPRSASLRGLLQHLAQHRPARGVSAESPLARHWLREALLRAAELETMSTHAKGLKFDASNFFVAEQGASLRLGGVAFKADVVESGSARLLPSFAVVAGEIVAGLAGPQNDLPGPLRAILRCCLDGDDFSDDESDPDDDGAPSRSRPQETAAPLSAAALLTHPFFDELNRGELEEAMEAFDQLFLATGAADDAESRRRSGTRGGESRD